MTLTDTIEKVQAETNSSFSTRVPGLQLAWDSTSYDALDRCPRYYQYSIIEGHGLDGEENPHLKFGTIFHSATELYAHERAEGQDHETALLSSVRHALEQTWDFKLSRPWASTEHTKNRKTLLRSIVWYLDKFQDDPLETLILDNGSPAVELSFRFDTGFTTSDGEPILLCGHIDKVVKWNTEIWITDKKTTKMDLDDNYFKQFTPNSQVSIYSIAGIITLSEQIDGLIIDGAQILATGSKFRRRPIPRSQDSLEEWLRDFQIKITEAEAYAKQQYWPMNRKSCGFGRLQCQFRPVCSAEPAMRSEILNSAYPKRLWDPLIPR